MVIDLKQKCPVQDGALDVPIECCLVSLYADDFTAFVVAAVRANMVGQTALATVGAFHQVTGFEGIVGAATIAATFWDFSLWKRCHELTPTCYNCKFHANAHRLGRRTELYRVVCWLSSKIHGANQDFFDLSNYFHDRVIGTQSFWKLIFSEFLWWKTKANGWLQESHSLWKMPLLK